jgi:integrase/recombinase XerD
MDISAAISSFVTHVRVEKGLSANTISAYRRDLVKFEGFAKKRKLALENVSRDDLVDFLAGLYREKLESRTVARHLVTLRNFFRFAQIQELITADPSINLESPKIRRSLPGYLRLDEVEKLLNQPDAKTALGMRDRAMLEVLYSTGLRVSELVSLRVSDLDGKTGCLRCIGKGDKERIVPVGRKALGMVDKYLRDERADALREPPRRKSEPRGRVEDLVGVWTPRRPAGGAYAAHVAAQLRDASAGTRRGSAIGAADAGSRRHFHHADLYARCRGKAETGVQGAPPTRVAV